MAIVLPHNKLSASAFTDVRQWVLRHSHLLGVVGVGRNMFMPHTQQKTGIVILRKKARPNEKSPPIFFGIAEQDGKDSRGNHLLKPDNEKAASLWTRLDHDLSDIVAAYREQDAG